MKFKQFLKNEGLDIFGFENKDQEDVKNRSPNSVKEDAPTKPVKRLDVNYVANLVCQYTLGEKQPQRLFFDTVRWGTGPGSIIMKFGTRYQILIEKMNYNLLGDPIWVTKRVYDLNSEPLWDKAESIAQELYQALQEVDSSDTDSPINNYKDFERLVKAIAYKTIAAVNEPLFYSDVKHIGGNQSFIQFNVRGQGLQARGQHRVEQVCLHLIYNVQEGTIRAMRVNTESRLGGHDWRLQPSDFDFTFTPTQPHEEIVDCLSTIMKYY